MRIINKWTELMLCVCAFFRTVIFVFRSCIHQLMIHNLVSCPVRDGIPLRTFAPFCCLSSPCWTSPTHSLLQTWTRVSCTEDGATRMVPTTSTPILFGELDFATVLVCCFPQIHRFSKPTRKLFCGNNPV